MFKWFHDLTTGESDYFNETDSNDSYVEGYDSNGDFHHINKCGNMGIDSYTGDVYYKMGHFIERHGSSHSTFSSFDDDDDELF